MVPVSWVWVLSMGSGSPGPAGRSFRMLGGSSAPGWFFRMCALRLLALLYTCRVKIWNENGVILMSAQKTATSYLYLEGLHVALDSMFCEIPNQLQHHAWIRIRLPVFNQAAKATPCIPCRSHLRTCCMPQLDIRGGQKGKRKNFAWYLKVKRQRSHWSPKL